MPLIKCKSGYYSTNSPWVNMPCVHLQSWMVWDFFILNSARSPAKYCTGSRYLRRVVVNGTVSDAGFVFQMAGICSLSGMHRCSMTL